MSPKRMGNSSSVTYLTKPSLETVYDEGTIGKSETLSFTYGAASMQGWRKRQEDKFTCLPKLCKNFSFFGLYDGHGGSEIAEFLKENLHFEIQNFLENEDDIELALYHAFLSIDSSFKDPDILADLNSKLEEQNRVKDKATLSRFCNVEDLRKIGEKAKSSKKTEDKHLQEVADSIKSNAADLNKEPNSAGSSQESSAAGTSKLPNIDGANQLPSTAGSTQKADVAVSSQDSHISGQRNEMNEAGPSQEFDSSTEEEIETDDDDMEDEDTEEDILDEMGIDEVEKPIDYLLNDQLESSDSDDEEFVVDNDETESEGTDDEVNPMPKFKLTAEEFRNLQPGDFSGSTATVVLLNETTMYVANVGDSRCVLSRRGRAEDMTIDHKPTDEDEEERIKLNGGAIRMGRINDTLDMSRAFGDYKLKCSSLNPPEQLVTCEPNIISLPISKYDEFLVIASDGIWNAMTSQEVVDYVQMRLQTPDCDLRDVCYEIFQLILAPDLENDGTGADNMSCIIIKFNQKGVPFPASNLPMVPGLSMVVPVSGTRLTAPLSAYGIPTPLCFSTGSLSFPHHSDTHHVYDLDGSGDGQNGSGNQTNQERH